MWYKFWKSESGFIGGFLFGSILTPIIAVYFKLLFMLTEYLIGGKP